MLSSRTTHVAFIFVLMLLAAWASGCVSIQVVDRTPSEVELTPAREQDEEHDLAVLAVDFDPPLIYEEIMARKEAGEGITLLVAVENRGTRTEKGVIVEVELSKDRGKSLFLHQEAKLDSIAPGEIKLVHFKDTEIPFSYEYVLRTAVRPVMGETHLVDNEKTYDLVITRP